MCIFVSKSINKKKIKDISQFISTINIMYINTYAKIDTIYVVHVIKDSKY